MALWCRLQQTKGQWTRWVLKHAGSQNGSLVGGGSRNDRDGIVTYKTTSRPSRG